MKDEAFLQVEGLEDIREDIRRKTSPESSRVVSLDQEQLPPAYSSIHCVDDHELKMNLAIQASRAIIPGAVSDNEVGAVAQIKSSVDSMISYNRMRRAQKARGYVDRESERPECCFEDEERAIDELNENMNVFRQVTNMKVADDDAARKHAQKRTRQRIIVWGCLIFLCLLFGCIGTIVGIVVGRKSGSEDSASVLQSVNTDKCYYGPTGVQSEPFSAFRLKLLVLSPDLETAIDNRGSAARASLCWLADVDTLQVDTEQHLLQRFVLALIYFNFVGLVVSTETEQHPLTATNWLDTSSVCHWQGVGCESSELQVVTSLNLQGMNLLEASIPTELFLLTDLLELNLSGNGITGQIPTNIIALQQLRTLSIYENDLTGQIPSEVFGLGLLNEVNLPYNSFSGTLPKQLASATTLESLRLDGTIKGTVPNLSNLTNLKVLAFSNMWGLVGSFPNLSGSSKLASLVLTGTMLKGTVPSYILSFSNLSYMELSQSTLSGSIPTEIGRLTGLKTLSIPTSFTGSIPTEMAFLSNLESLALPPNLAGTLPSELCALPNLVDITVTCNQCTCCKTC